MAMGKEFQSQTGSPSSSDQGKLRGEQGTTHVSIPNGKPILFRPICSIAWILSIGCFNPKREAHPLQTIQNCPWPTAYLEFQSQTGSPSSSDRASSSVSACRRGSFNPKREAHPLQTKRRSSASSGVVRFQSQTGSPSSSDLDRFFGESQFLCVSIPNGKPILFRPRDWSSPRMALGVSIPNGKPILFRLSLASFVRRLLLCFNPKREAHPLQTPVLRSSRRRC